MKGNRLKKGIGILAAFVVVLGVGSVTVAYGKSENVSMAQPEKKQQEETEVPEVIAEDETYEAEATENEVPEAIAGEVVNIF